MTLARELIWATKGSSSFKFLSQFFLHYSWTLIENSDELFAKVMWCSWRVPRHSIDSLRISSFRIVTLINANASFICLYYSIIDCLAANRGLRASTGDESRWKKINNERFKSQLFFDFLTRVYLQCQALTFTWLRQ